MYNYRDHYEFGKQGLMRMYRSRRGCVATCLCRCAHPQSAVLCRTVVGAVLCGMVVGSIPSSFNKICLLSGRAGRCPER